MCDYHQSGRELPYSATNTYDQHELVFVGIFIKL